MKSRQAFVQLALANARELVRDPMSFFFVLIMPFLFIGLFYLISFSLSNQTFRIGLVVPEQADPPVQQMADALASLDGLNVRVVPDEEGQRLLEATSIDALVRFPARLTEGPIAVAAAEGRGTAALVVQQALDRMTRQSNPVQIQALTADGDEPFDPLRFGLPGVLVMAFSSLALFGTATPLIQLRQRGTLRLLGLTPLRRFTFIMAQVPARLTIGIVQLVIILIFAQATGLFRSANLGLTFLSALVSLLMLFTLGVLLGGLFRSVEVASGFLAGLMPVVLMLTGVILPLDILPAVFSRIAQFIPLTYVGDMLRFHLVGTKPTYPLLLDYAVTLASAIVFAGLASLTFRWDQGEAR